MQILLHIVTEKSYRRGTTPIGSLLGGVLITPLGHGHNYGWKVEGDQGLGPNTGALAPRARPEAGLWGSLPLWGSGGINHGKFLKTQMLNPAFWVASALISGLPRTCVSEQTTSMSRANWCGMTESHWEVTILAVKFLAFWKLRPNVGGTDTLLVPQPKSWETSLSRSPRLLRLWRKIRNTLVERRKWKVHASC